MGQRYDSVYWIGYSFRVPRFDSQCPHGSSQPSITTVRGYLTLPSAYCALHGHRHRCRQSILPYKIKLRILNLYSISILTCGFSISSIFLVEVLYIFCCSPMWFSVRLRHEFRALCMLGKCYTTKAILGFCCSFFFFFFFFLNSLS